MKRYGVLFAIAILLFCGAASPTPLSAQMPTGGITGQGSAGIAFVNSGSNVCGNPSTSCVITYSPTAGNEVWIGVSLYCRRKSAQRDNWHERLDVRE
jgi:hypothetical protein